MSTRSLIERIKQAAVLQAFTVKITSEGTPAEGVDMKAYNALMFVANMGVSLDTLSASVYYELEVQHSDDDSTWTAATDAMISSSVTGTNTGTFAKTVLGGDDQSYSVGVVNPTEFRYWRVLCRATGTHTNGTPISIDALKGHPQTLPTA